MRKNFSMIIILWSLWTPLLANNITATQETSKIWLFCLVNENGIPPTEKLLDTKSARIYYSENQNAKKLNIFSIKNTCTQSFTLTFGTNTIDINPTIKKIRINNKRPIFFEKLFFCTGEKLEISNHSPFLYHGLVEASAIKTFLDLQNVLTTLTSDLLPLLNNIEITNPKKDEKSKIIRTQNQELSAPQPIFILFNSTINSSDD